MFHPGKALGVLAGDADSPPSGGSARFLPWECYAGRDSGNASRVVCADQHLPMSGLGRVSLPTTGRRRRPPRIVRRRRSSPLLALGELYSCKASYSRGWTYNVQLLKSKPAAALASMKRH
jgi:hypothetical protein